MPVSRPRPALRATRRTTIAAAPALALAGCRWGPAEDDPETSPAPDADDSIVERARLAIRQQAARLQAHADRHVGLASALAPLIDAHVRHAELLATDPGEALSTFDEGHSTAAQALRQVRREETALQSQLATLAQEADSGTLARALATMSASIAQHLVALPELAKGPA